MSEAEFVVSTFDSSLLVSKPHIWNNIDWTFKIKQRSLYIVVIGWTILEDPSRRSSRWCGGRAVWDNWLPSVLPPISWGRGGFDREDLSEDSWHSLNRTWQGDGESFHTLSSGESYRSFLSVISDGEDSVSDPGDQLLELLEEAEVFRDSLGTLEASPGVPRGWASFPPGSRGQVTAGWATRGRGSFQPGSRGTAGWTPRERGLYQPGSRVPSPTRWVPGERGLYQLNLREPVGPVFRGGWAVRGAREHRGGGEPGGISSVGVLRLLEDEDRVQAPYRQNSRPLDRLARRHWTQLGLSHRRPIHPALLHPVFYPPRPLPLIQGPQQQVFPEEYMQRQHQLLCYRY